MLFTLTDISHNEIKLLESALVRLPYSEVVVFINKINRQLVEQQAGKDPENQNLE